MARVVTTTETISLDGAEVAYRLARSPKRVKTVSLSVDPELGLKVSVPHRMPDAEIERFLVSRAKWIRDVQEKLAQTRRTRDWDKRETIKLRGDDILVVVDDLPKNDRRNVVLTQRSLDGMELRILVPTGVTGARRTAAVVEALHRWYRQEAESHLPDRVLAWLPPWRQALKKLGIYRPGPDDEAPRVNITNARKRWGSCSLSKSGCSVNLSWQLITVADHLVDFVIVHELAHLKEMNHQQAFWELVGTMLPDWKDLREELGNAGRELAM